MGKTNNKNLCMVLEFDRWGNMTIFREATKRGHILVLHNLESAVKQAVARFGPFPDSSYLFDFNAGDVPSCALPVKVSAKACCIDGMSLIGVSRNILCKCSTPVPIHANQIPKSINKMLRSEDPFEWEGKKDKAVWHGSRNWNRDWTNSYISHFRNDPERRWLNNDLTGNSIIPRERIVSMSQKYPEILDASFEIQPWKVLLGYKYIVTVSGNSYSGMLKPALLSNSCVLRQDSIATEWYEHLLVPWTHYIPVRYDLSDLIERIEWARSHDAECQKIAENGRSFAKVHFSAETIDKFVYDTIWQNGL